MAHTTQALYRTTRGEVRAVCEKTDRALEEVDRDVAESVRRSWTGAPTSPSPTSCTTCSSSSDVWTGVGSTIAIDDHTRLAYAEVHDDECAETCAEFLRRAARFFATHCIERVMTDNPLTYRRSCAWREALAEIGAQARSTRRYRPQTKGKAER